MTGLRPIDIGTRTKVAGDLAERPALVWLEIATLGLDDRYQRPLGPKNWKAINRIAAGFDWARFSPILVAPAGDGHHAIIDGQHRTHAALMRGYTHVPAMVVPMTVKEQAAAFAGVNGDVTAITLYHVYRAALTAGEVWAVRARDCVEAAGCRLMRSNASSALKGPREIYPMGLIRSHVELGRGEVVTRALAAIVGSQNEGNVFAWSSAILKPWFDVVADAPEDADALRGFLNVVDLEALYARAFEVRKRPEYHELSQFQITRSTIKAALNEYRKTGQVKFLAA